MEFNNVRLTGYQRSSLRAALEVTPPPRDTNTQMLTQRRSAELLPHMGRGAWGLVLPDGGGGDHQHSHESCTSLCLPTFLRDEVIT